MKQIYLSIYKKAVEGIIHGALAFVPLGLLVFLMLLLLDVSIMKSSIACVVISLSGMAWGGFSSASSDNSENKH